MLSLKRIAGGPRSEEYNAEKYQVDYRTKSRQPSEWMGKGAARLGLSGQVDRQAFLNLFRGLTPDGTEPLINFAAIQKQLKHSAGTDQVVSAPKSVSVVWGLFPEWKEGIEKALWDACRETIAYEQSTIAFARRGKGGVRREPGEMVVAAVMEFYGRNGDPQAHIHAFIFNILGHSDGFGTFDTKRLFERQVEMRQFFHAGLARNLTQDMGFTIESTDPTRSFEPGEFFRIAGVPQTLCDAKSTRRAEILVAKAKSGAKTAKQTDVIAIATRRPKMEFSEDFLREKWRAVATRMGYDLAEMREAILHPHLSETRSPESDERLTRNVTGTGNFEDAESVARDNVRSFSPKPKPDTAAAIPNVEQAASERATDDHARKPNLRVFAREDASILETLARSAMEAKLPEPIVDRLMDRVVEQFEKRKPLGKVTNHVENAEEAKESLVEVLATADEMRANVRHAIDRDWIRSGINGKLTSRPADAAYVEILSNTGAIACVEAKPGVDSAMLVGALARKYPKESFKVKTFTSTATAASELETIAQTPTHTVGQLLYRLKPPTGDVLKHHAMQLVRAAMDKPTSKFERWKFDRNTVVVVTEAQALKTKQLETLLAKAETAGAKVILIGDSTQIARREPHNAFSEIGNRVGKISLPEPVRQKEEWVAQANRQIAQGDVRGGLSEYAAQKKLHLAKDQRSASVAVVEHWKRLPKEQQDGKTLMITGGEREAKVLNRLAQHARRQAGGLGFLMWQRVDQTWVYRGDRVLFHIGSKHYGFRAGDLGTIQRINLSSMTIKLDRTASFLGIHRQVRVDVPKDLYRGLTLGYAVSATDALGISCDRALVLPQAGGQDIRGLCTQLSRARTETHIFTTPRTVGEDVDAIARTGRLRMQTPIKNEDQGTAIEVGKHQDERSRQGRGIRV